MAVPEAAMNEDRGAMTLQNDVRRAGQFSGMESEAVAHSMEKASHHKLRLGVLPPHSAHQGAASVFGKVICHIDARRAPVTRPVTGRRLKSLS
jgi:hypothetical protein